MNKEDAPPNQIRFAYFGDSLRIVYEVTPDVDEEIVEVLRVEAFSGQCQHDKWMTISKGIMNLLDCLNSDLKEAIRESYYVITEDGELIYDTRSNKTPVNP